MQNNTSDHDLQIEQLRRDVTQLQKEKAEFQQLYFALLEMSLDLIYLVDKDGVYVFVNKAAAAFHGVSPSDMIGKSTTDFEPPDVARYLEDHIAKVIETGELYVNEAPFLLPPKQLWADVKMIPVKNSAGEVVSVLEIIRDLSEQKMAENALRESEERFRQIITQMPYPVVICALDGTAVMVNDEFLSLINLPSSDAIVGKVNILHHPYLEKLGVRFDKEKILNGEPVFFQEVSVVPEWAKKKEGVKVKAITLEVTVFPVYLQPEEVFQIVIICKDISERKLAEIALLENEKKMRTQYKSFPIPTYTWQKTGDDLIMVDYNDAAYQFTQGGVRDLLGKKVTDVFAHEPKLIVNMSRCLQEKSVVTTESPVTFPVTKSEKYLAVTYVFVEPDLVMVHTEDVTEKQKLEHEIRRAEHLDSIGLLAGGIAHDFNNLLAGVFGYIGLAREYGKNNDNVADCLDKAMLVFGQAKALTQQLLTFSKGGSPVRKLASIGELLRDMAAFVLAGTQVKSQFNIPNDLWACEVDSGQLSEVINNILMNAQQAMPKGGIVAIASENITLHNHRSLPLVNGKYVRISIRDHGVGIPRHHLGKVFDPFFSTKQKGTGLGLTIAYSIIKKHGGHIEISSVVGDGTEVAIYLPASQEPFVNVNNAKDQKRSGQGNILLMDDEEFLLDALSKIIRTLGYTVQTVRGGNDAVTMYQNAMESATPFDAVILDLTIPGGMGGKQAMNEMKKIDPKVKAIATSGYSEDPVIADPREFGFKGALRKPYSIDELSEVLEKVLSEP